MNSQNFWGRGIQTLGNVFLKEVLNTMKVTNSTLVKFSEINDDGALPMYMVYQHENAAGVVYSKDHQQDSISHNELELSRCFFTLAEVEKAMNDANAIRAFRFG